MDKRAHNLAWVEANGLHPADLTLVLCRDSIGEYGGIPHSHYALIPTADLKRYGMRVEVVKEPPTPPAKPEEPKPEPPKAEARQEKPTEHGRGRK